MFNSLTVQHILASTFSQRCVIWDLKKNEAILKLTDSNARVSNKFLSVSNLMQYKFKI